MEPPATKADREPGRKPVVAIAVPLEPDLASRIRAVDSGVAVIFEPDLLPPARFPGDHQGDPAFHRTPDQASRWFDMLGAAEVLFGIPSDSGEGLAAAVRAAPNLRWVQAAAAGAGQQVVAAELTPDELARVAVTTASGVHGRQLAEFALLGLLAFTKGLPRLMSDKLEKRWDHYPQDELAGKTLLVIGFGSIGSEVGRLARAVGLNVIGVRRSAENLPGPNALAADDEAFDVRSLASLPELLPLADAVVVALPGTGETERLLDAAAIRTMRRGAIFVNVGRGTVVDEPALVAALREGHLRGSALDVFATEPLPPDSPLWEMDNVLISPHTSALSIHENERIVELFCENLRRYLCGEDLINRIRPERPY